MAFNGVLTFRNLPFKCCWSKTFSRSLCTTLHKAICASSPLLLVRSLWVGNNFKKFAKFSPQDSCDKNWPGLNFALPKLLDPNFRLKDLDFKIQTLAPNADQWTALGTTTSSYFSDNALLAFAVDSQQYNWRAISLANNSEIRVSEVLLKRLVCWKKLINKISRFRIDWNNDRESLPLK